MKKMIHDEELANNMMEYYNLTIPNPFYPVSIDDYPKLVEISITEKGLIYFNELRRKFTLGKELSDDELKYLSHLWLSYSLSNKSVQEYNNWSDYIFRIGREWPGIGKHTPKIKLIDLGCAVDNPDFDPKLKEMNSEWRQKSFKKMHRKLKE